MVRNQPVTKRRKTFTKRPKRRRAARVSQRREPGSIHIKNGVITMMIPGKLKSLNQLRNGLARHGDTKAWEARIKKAIITFNDESVELPLEARARVEIVRLIPSRACLLDQTNAEGGAKGIEDAIKRLGYIVDDNHKWIDRRPISQAVSDDRQYWVLLTITIIP